MFQDIQPHHYNVQFSPKPPEAQDFIILIKGNTVLTCQQPQITLPTCAQAITQLQLDANQFLYLFSIDDHAFYFSASAPSDADGFSWQNMQLFRTLQPAWLGYGGATAFHLAHWYTTHVYCGKCAAPFAHKDTERALYCSACGTVMYPQIAPVVITGVIYKDRLLLTKYSSGHYKNYALIAGFAEIGESLEAAARREVLEEVGLKIKNLRYYKSQPWAFSSSLLAGFFAEVDGDTDIQLDTAELSEAAWFSRSELPPNDSTLSLTWDMIEHFRSGGPQHRD